MNFYRIEIEPRPFARPRFNKGRGFNDPKYAAYKNALSILILKECGRPLMTGPIEISLAFSLKRPKRPKAEFPIVRPDLDNYIKAVLDAANGILWEDDSQVSKISAVKTYDTVPAIQLVFGAMRGWKKVAEDFSKS